VTVTFENIVGVQDGSSKGVRDTDNIKKRFVGKCQHFLIQDENLTCTCSVVIRKIHSFADNYKGTDW
jgi:hypothetical protein